MVIIFVEIIFLQNSKRKGINLATTHTLTPNLPHLQPQEVPFNFLTHLTLPIILGQRIEGQTYISIFIYRMIYIYVYIYIYIYIYMYVFVNIVFTYFTAKLPYKMKLTIQGRHILYQGYFLSKKIIWTPGHTSFCDCWSLYYQKYYIV